jgi:hypothetical protein
VGRTLGWVVVAQRERDLITIDTRFEHRVGEVWSHLRLEEDGSLAAGDDLVVGLRAVDQLERQRSALIRRLPR